MKLKEKVKFVNKDKSLFFPTLRKRIDAYFLENNISRHANTAMLVKTVILLLAYVVPFIFILTLQPSFGISLMLWFVMGLGVAGIGMSVMHDANHGAYSSDKRINYLLGHSLNMVGGSATNWK